ncbi:MAG: response regulator [Longimicrobiales bacterium]|nr:response regulator [Longimicrobiales bacterium]
MSDPRPTLLLVEDDELLRESFALLLDDAGYDVLPAGTASDAVEVARKRQPDLVVLDLGLPDRPGLEVVREIRADPELGTTPVIALTGRVGAEQEKACLEAGCDRFLTKPVPARTLLSELARFVGT